MSPRPRHHLAFWLLAVAPACAGRARSAATVATRPAFATEHCWWSTNRTSLPPDSVVTRFAQAFAAAGFLGVSRAGQGDTAWVQTAPTALPSAPAGGTYAMHAVAYATGDSTHYRYFLSAFGRAAADTALGGVSIPLCSAVARAAAIGGVQPAQPTGEEGAAVWRWRP